MKRKLLSVFLSLAMVLTMMPVFAMADTSVGGGTTPGADSGSSVEASGINSYEALLEAIRDAKDGDTITLAGDIDVTKTIVVENKTITLNLAGNKLYNTTDIWNADVNDWSMISVRGGADLTIRGNGILDAKENDCYAVDTQDGGKVTIENGNFIGNISVVYVYVGSASINGGKFSIKQLNTNNVQDGYGLTINCKDDHYKDGTASIVITGGTFSNFDPAANKAEGEGTNLCAEGYVTEKNDDNTYTVKPLEDVAVAQIGENSFYRTINEAVNTSNISDTITLLKDTVEDVTVPSGKNITLNLNGKKLTNVASDTITVENKAKLTITGDGTVDNVNHAMAAISNNGECTLNGGTFTRSKENGITADNNGGNSFYTILNHGRMNINDGVNVKQNGHYSSLLENGYQSVNSGNQRTGYVEKINVENPILTVKGGVFDGGLNTIKNDDNGTANIENGTLKNYTQSAFQNHHIATIKGGIFDGANVYAVLNCGVSNCSVNNSDKHETTIIDGYFNGKISKTVGTITISGGYFTSDPTAYLATYTGTEENKQFKVKASDKTPYVYKVVLANTSDVLVVPAIGEVNVSDISNLGLDVNQKEAVENAAKNVEAEKINVAAAEVANKISDDDANKYIEDAKKGTEGEAVTYPEKIEVRAYLDITPKAYKEEAKGVEAVYTLEITPKYDIVVVGKNSAANKKEKVVGSGTLNVTNETNITVQLPAGFVANTDTDTLYVQHKGHEYDATVTKKTEKGVDIYTALFKNPDGFSEFTISKNSQAVAKIGDKKYTSLQDAVDAVDAAETSRSTIEIVGGNTSKEYTATMTGSSKTITVKNSTNADKITVKVNGDSKDIEKNKTADFTYTRHSSSGSSTTTYTVTVGSVSNGTVTSSHKSAASGATVTLTVKPADGYAVEAVTAKDAKGNAVKVTEKDGKYTFAMPASNVTVSASFVKKGEQPAAKLFDDVAQGAYYYDAVKWAVDKGVTNGKTSNLFGSDDPCTRAQIVTFLWRAAGSPAASASVSFTDVKDSDYYAKAVAWAVEKGITNGTGDGKFSSDDTCTRAQCAAFLYRAAGSPEVTDAAAFSDVAADAYYAKAVAWAEKNGITNGLGNGKFGSDNSCTRAQIITFLYRTYQGK